MMHPLCHSLVRLYPQAAAFILVLIISNKGANPFESHKQWVKSLLHYLQPYKSATQVKPGLQAICRAHKKEIFKKVHT
jgi:hypothetical protein